jgi:hypothetical protein
MMTVVPHPYGRVFTAGVGLGHEPVGDDWSAFDQDHLWFATPPRQVSTGDHVFALGAGRGSAVLGLYEVTRGGPLRAPENPWDPKRWPWNIGVRALVTVPPPITRRVAEVTAPRSTAARVRDPDQMAELYSALDGT